jgi:hypothetical protein
MLTFRQITALVIVLAMSAQGFAQNFEGDSVQYTPIPKPGRDNSRVSLQPFGDTVQHENLIKYYFHVNAGALTGCDNCTASNPTTFTTSTVHGVTIGRKLRAGAGLGFDSYEGWQTLPLFGEISYDLIGTRNRNALFLAVQYGWAHAWDNRVPFEPSLVGVDGGSLLGGQAGYRIKYHNIRVGLLFGLRRQFVSSDFHYPTYYLNAQGILVEGSPNTVSIEREMRRVMISLQVGWN